MAFTVPRLTCFSNCQGERDRKMLQPKIYVFKSNRDDVQSMVLVNRRGLRCSTIHDTTKHLDKTKHMEHVEI